MLLEMRLRDLGVIADAVLELGPGLTVVTGETGAGKTLIVSGLGLLLGGRGDPGAVRSGASSAIVEGRLRVEPDGPVAERARDAGASLDDGDELLVSRSVSAEGRSRAHLGGRGVPVGTLAELAADLVAVHGQSDQIRLQVGARQREALDRFGGPATAGHLATYREGWHALRAVDARLREIIDRARERAREAELLRLGLAEVERLAPQPGEDVALRAEADRLGHAEELRLAAGRAREVLTGGDGGDAATLVADARRALDGLRDHDTALGTLADRLAEVGYLVDDIGAECASYLDRVEADPVRLAAVEDRRAELAGLTRAYGEDVDAVLEWAQRSSARLAELDADEDTVAGLQAEHDRLNAELARSAAALSDARTSAAQRLGSAVTVELADLSMGGAALTVRVQQHDDEDGLPVDLTGGNRRVRPTPDGVDEIEFLLAPHPGAGPRPLARGASGGELSRVMLGLEVVLGAADPVPTFVFDEVDAGVGGKAALAIGQRLARLARTSQVLVVTHLAQVAAFADRHLLVTKSSDGAVTESGVHALTRDGRVRELARMLGGVEDSGSARAHAEELLALADVARSGREGSSAARSSRARGRARDGGTGPRGPAHQEPDQAVAAG